MTNANAYIEQAIQSIEAERDQRIADAKTRITLEVVSQNSEIDTARDKALEELQIKLNADISSLQEAFAKQRNDIIDASEKQKEANINARISIETRSINDEYANKLAGLRKVIEG